MFLKRTYDRKKFIYNYTYDALNRLSSGIYGEVVPTYNFVGGNFLKFAYQVNNKYDENSLTYDADGNIKTLQRMGPSDPANCASKVQIDNLLYVLIPGTPKLQKITDSAPSANRAKGFNPGTASSSAVYAYDKNGNLTTDPYKGITIQYNFLNLPRLITKGGANISIKYDASGRKWSQTGTEGIREYVGGIEYVDQKIQSVQHGEGRLVATYNAGGTAIESIRAEYWRQDHLGNTRVAFCDFNLDGVIATKDDPNTTGNDIEITQENHYYPFGLNHEGPWYQTVQPKNNYTYNGKEYVEDLGLNWNDYGARWYDPAVGRFFSLDPIASNYPDFSPFSYAANSPINNVDFLGLGPSVADMIVGSWLQTKEGEDRSFTFDELEAETGQGDDDCCGGNKFNILPGDGTRGAAMNAQLERAFFEENKSQEELIAGWEAQGEAAFETVTLIYGGYVAKGFYSGGRFIILAIKGRKALAKGKWITTSEYLSDAAAAYQRFITGRAANQSFLFNGVKFDGVAGGVLKDAKSGMMNFVNPETGQFHRWWKGASELAEQARRQLQAAGGIPIEWHFQNKNVLEAAQNLLKSRGISGIKLIYTPF